MTPLLLFLLPVLTLGWTPTHGPSAPDKDTRVTAMRHAAKGRAAFDALQLEEAAHEYGIALQQLHRAAAHDGDLDDLPPVLQMLAAIYLLEDDCRAAQVMLHRLLAIEPDFAPPAAIFNPEMRACVASAARKTPDGATSVSPLTLRASPPDAEIFIDGRFAGRGLASLPPVTPSIPHYIVVFHPRYTPCAGVIEPAHLRGKQESMYIPLAPLPGET